MTDHGKIPSLQHHHQRHRHGQGYARLAGHLGRDLPDAHSWEFNYRGELDFLHQSLAQVESRKVKVEDGWLYFVHGWTQVVAQVLHIDLTPALFDKLNEAASTVRGK